MGVNVSVLEDFQTVLKDENILGVVIVKNDKIIWEYYKRFYYRWKLFRLYSVTKSFTGTLVGLALHDGLIPSLDQKVADYFPMWQRDGVDEQKKRITIRHLLTHTSGLVWSFGEIVDQYNDSENAVAYVLKRPMGDRPGRMFNYNAGGSHLLATIVDKVTGGHFLQYATKKLFTPLGINHFYWMKRDEGYYDGGEGLHLTARDLARFGYLFLREGCFRGKQIIPRDWIKQATQKQAGQTPYSYGYHWWTCDFSQTGKYFLGRGYQGQRVYVFPSLDMVVVFIGSLKDSESNLPERLLSRYVLKAVLGEPLKRGEMPMPAHSMIEPCVNRK
jgi:CubicO group peptidase (beta-lactamase class C family)